MGSGGGIKGLATEAACRGGGSPPSRQDRGLAFEVEVGRAQAWAGGTAAAGGAPGRAQGSISWHRLGDCGPRGRVQLVLQRGQGRAGVEGKGQAARLSIYLVTRWSMVLCTC